MPSKPPNPMPIEKETGYETGKERRQVEVQCKRLHKQCNELVYLEKQPHKWQNQIAKDLNMLLSRAFYFLETDRDESDVAAAQATLRIVRRVEEFEGIRRAK